MVSTAQKCLCSVAVTLLLGLNGCATAPMQTPEEIVRDRAQAWLDALMAFDIDGVYSFTSPAYQSAHSARFHSKNYAGRGMWKAAELGKIQCDDAIEYGTCEVQVIITYRGFNMKDDMVTSTWHTWVNLDNVWYSQPRR